MLVGVSGYCYHKGCFIVSSLLMLQTAKWQVAAKECMENSEDEAKHEAKREVKMR